MSREKGEKGEKGGLKRRERDLCSSLFPKCSLMPRHPQRVTELDWEEKGEGGKEVI